MNCIKCKRSLKNPQSVKLGMGPICYRKFVAHKESRPDDTTYIENDGSLTVRRLPDNSKSVNIPHVWIHHSPDGFEWGYGGSGPAELALNALLFFTRDKDFSWKNHQDFKWLFIATLPIEGGSIPGEIIRYWIDSRKIEQPQPNLFGIEVAEIQEEVKAI